jgi:hypothetical protein
MAVLPDVTYPQLISELNFGICGIQGLEYHRFKCSVLESVEDN